MKKTIIIEYECETIEDLQQIADGTFLEDENGLEYVKEADGIRSYEDNDLIEWEEEEYLIDLKLSYQERNPDGK